MNIQAIKALSDNYIWVLEQDNQVVVVDPGEAQPVLDFLANRAVSFTTILLTHNHHDHVGGVATLVEQYPELKVMGPQECSDYTTTTVQPGDHLEVLGRDFEVKLTAGHTAGHISYYTPSTLLCGDAFFSAGCGRVFTGDYQAQYDALKWFETLPDETHVFAAHEYTVTNLRFAQTVEPANQVITDALVTAQTLLSQGKPTLPTTIGHEKTVNVFLQAETVANFKQLRDLRDDF